MIKFNELKQGDYIMGDYEGTRWEGEVTRLNGDEKQVCVDNGVQGFWFEQDQLYPIPINDEQLLKLNFTKQENDDGSVKYIKGSFRILVPQNNNFSSFEMWYR